MAPHGNCETAPKLHKSRVPGKRCSGRLHVARCEWALRLNCPRMRRSPDRPDAGLLLACLFAHALHQHSNFFVYCLCETWYSLEICTAASNIAERERTSCWARCTIARLTKSTRPSTCSSAPQISSCLTSLPLRIHSLRASCPQSLQQSYWPPVLFRVARCAIELPRPRLRPGSRSNLCVFVLGLMASIL